MGSARHGEVPAARVMHSAVCVKIQVRVEGTTSILDDLGNLVGCVVSGRVFRNPFSSNSTNTLIGWSQINPDTTSLQGHHGVTGLVWLSVVPSGITPRVCLEVRNHEWMRSHEIPHCLLVGKLIQRIFLMVETVSQTVS